MKALKAVICEQKSTLIKLKTQNQLKWQKKKGNKIKFKIINSLTALENSSKKPQQNAKQKSESPNLKKGKKNYLQTKHWLTRCQ